MHYRRITPEDRLAFKALLDIGLSNAEIARKKGFHPSTVGRERVRNTGGRGYRPQQAQSKADERQSYRWQARRMLPPMIEAVERKLRLRWSPETIRNRFKAAGLPYVSAESIYKHIDRDRKSGGTLWRHLRYSRKRRWRRFPSAHRRGIIKNARPIDERSKSANKRKKRGHWERDCMLGSNRKNVVLVICDRKTRYNRFSKLSRHLAPAITKRTIKLLHGFPVRSITNDRGQEFSGHKKLERKLGRPVYFCDPYSSYQRGTNENRIGILRQYIPKGSDISKLHGLTLKRYEKEINSRPMKCLGWRTPYEVMFKKSCTTEW